MPGLALIAEEFSDRVGFLTILLDMDRDGDRAIQITENVNATFLTVDADESTYYAVGIFFESGYIPESILIDGDGNIVDSIVGGSEDEYRTMIENALDN